MSKQLHETVTPASSYIHSVMLSENPHKPADPESVIKDTELQKGEPRTQQLIKAAAISCVLFLVLHIFAWCKLFMPVSFCILPRQQRLVTMQSMKAERTDKHL